jgi:nucleoside-diphosphate-sugar epimerase
VTENVPECIENECVLDEMLSRPYDELIAFMRRLPGDIAILGVAGKMGLTLARMARRAADAVGVRKRIVGISRFSRPESRDLLESWGVEAIKCDLLDRNQVAALPQFENLVSMVGRKFGTTDNPELTWAVNTIVPENISQHFRAERMVVFSTGCVYPLVTSEDALCTEETAASPVGEYAQACLARERIHQYYSNRIPVCLLRLNYAVDMRYSVLHDIATNIYRGREVDVSVGHFNLIWQGDANHRALMALEHCTDPAQIINVTGPETLSIQYVAEFMAGEMGKEVRFTGQSGSPAYLANAQKSFDLFGYPKVGIIPMMCWMAHWVKNGLPSLNKPTHFQETKGSF